MVVRIKELVLRYEDDGSESPLTATQHKEKYAPLNMSIHHHCAPPPVKKDTEAQNVVAKGTGDITFKEEIKPDTGRKTIKVDLQEA
jgi:hypothetical protein